MRVWHDTRVVLLNKSNTGFWPTYVATRRVTLTPVMVIMVFPQLK